MPSAGVQVETIVLMDRTMLVKGAIDEGVMLAIHNAAVVGARTAAGITSDMGAVDSGALMRSWYAVSHIDNGYIPAAAAAENAYASKYPDKELTLADPVEAPFSPYESLVASAAGHHPDVEFGTTYMPARPILTTTASVMRLRAPDTVIKTLQEVLEKL